MQLTLKIDGEEKTFTSRLIYLGTLLKLSEMETRIDFEKLNKPEEQEEFIQFICHDIFGDQFTPEQMKSGLTVKEWKDKYLDFLMTVHGVLPKDDSGQSKN